MSSTYWSLVLTRWYVPGSARVEGDEEEDGDDDIEKEFNFGNFDPKETLSVSGSKLHSQLSIGQSSFAGSAIGTSSVHNSNFYANSTIPLLTYGEEVSF